MNCHGFEMGVTDLARNQIMDARAKAEALCHADACLRCRASLAEGRMLTAGVAGLAGSAETEEAPPRIEALLIAALGEQQKQVGVPGRKRRWPWWAVAAALAAIIVSVALIALRVDKLPRAEQAGKSGEAIPSVPPMAVEQKKAAPEAPGKKDVEPGRDDSPQKAKPQRRIMQVVDRTRSVNAKNNKPAASSSSGEIATDFIPLVQGEDLTRMEGGQVMRVEMPRSALMSYGLPMNMERANERIKADVVVGNDGLARAIRFVR